MVSLSKSIGYISSGDLAKGQSEGSSGVLGSPCLRSVTSGYKAAGRVPPLAVRMHVFLMHSCVGSALTESCLSVPSFLFHLAAQTMLSPFAAACREDPTQDFLNSARENLHWNLRKMQE